MGGMDATRKEGKTMDWTKRKNGGDREHTLEELGREMTRGGWV